jgi:hypothetical protein
MGSLQATFPGQERVQEILWGLAHRILQDLMTDYSGPEMLAQILRNPDAFLRTLFLKLYGRLPEKGHPGLNLPVFIKYLTGSNLPVPFGFPLDKWQKKLQ